MPTPNNFRVKSGLTVGTTISGGNTTVTGFVNATSSVNTATYTVGTNFVANSIGVYHTGTVNAASHTVGTSFTANSTLVNAAAINVVNQVNTATLYAATSANIASAVQANSTGIFTTGTANAAAVSVGTNFIANTTRVVIGTAVGLQANGGIGTAGQVLTSNATTVYWSTPTTGTVTSIATANGLSGGPITSTGTLGVTTGPTLTVNTTGIHVNSALSITDLTLSGNLTVSGTTTYVNSTTLNVGDNIITLNADVGGAVAPTENAGIEINRGSSANVQFLWDETNDRWSTNGQPLALSSLVATGAASGITTLAAGNTSITGFVNATASVNSAILAVGTSFIANTTGAYHTGTVNAASHTVGTAFVANSTQTTYGQPVLFNNGQQLRFQTVNTTAYAYFTQQNDDNFVFYTSNTTYGSRAVFSVFANSVTSTFNLSVGAVFNGGIYANASYGTAGQLLTSNGTGVYWSSPGAASVNTAAQYTWTNTHIFSANVAFGNSIGIPTGNSTVSGGLIYFAGLADLNWKMGRNTNGTTKWYYTNNTIDILGANSNLEGIVLGNSLVGGASYFETGHAGTYIAANVTIGNTSSKSTINSTAFSGTANNSTYFDTATWAAPKAIGTGTANSGAFTTVTASGNVTADVIISLNNGGGTNIKIGDDVWLGDINTADTVTIRGQQSANNGYIVFGNADTTTKLGRAGTGPLTYNGAFSVTGVTTLSANLVMANNNITRPVLTGYTEAEVSNTAVTGTWTMDCGAANFFDLTLTGSITISPTNVPPSTRVWSGTIVAKQDATGGRTITWPTGIKWPGGSAPPATTTANAIDIWSLMTYDGGSTWVGSLTVKNVA